MEMVSDCGGTCAGSVTFNIFQGGFGSTSATHPRRQTGLADPQVVARPDVGWWDGCSICEGHMLRKIRCVLPECGVVFEEL